MLFELFIENIAIIEKTSIRFDNGFNVLTGETGAGKSILINSINSILGERVTKDIVRTGAQTAVVTAVFKDVSQLVIDELNSLGFKLEKNDDLIINREINASGGTVCRIMGQPTNVSVLRELALLLINIHGQHNTQELLSSDKHIGFIDMFGNLDEDVKRYEKQYNTLLSLRKSYSNLNINEEEKSRQIDVLTFQIEEIENAKLSEEEEKKLISNQKIIQNFAALNSTLNEAHISMYGDELGENLGALNSLNRASEKLKEVVRLTGENEDLSSRFDELYYEINDLSINITSLLSEIDLNPDELNNIEFRLDEIHILKRKYANTIPEILELLISKKEELKNIQLSSENMDQLKIDIDKEEEKTFEIAEILSEKRKVSGEAFCEKVGEQLEYLDMPDVEISFEHNITNLSKRGIDSIEFLISTNIGETKKPLAKIASGGELSRIMLSIKSVLANKDDVDTMIFDEIDAGVSGRAAQKIGRKLKETSKGRQVICVTHLAQIAALADKHLLIEKKTNEDRTFTEVKTLTRGERINEIARIIGGEEITHLTQRSADEMLRLAGN